MHIKKGLEDQNDSDIVDSDILEALKSEGIIVESKNKIRLK